MIYLVWFILIAICLFIVRKFLSRFKFPKISAIAVFSGAVKVGKTGVSLACAYSKYRVVHRRWRIVSTFRKIFGKCPIEEPLFYSNIPLAHIKYYDLTTDHILRKKRFNYGSVVFIDEASLLADCYLSATNKDLSIELLKFFKLFGHESHGGYCILNSQSMSDLAIAIRKCTNQYFYIHSTHSVPLLPISFCKLREERYSEDGTSINAYTDDVEQSLKTVLFRKRVFKMYDSFAFSSLTDNLPLSNKLRSNPFNSSLKSTYIASFRPEFVEMYKNIKINNKECKKND